MSDLLPSMWFQPGFKDNDVVVVLNSPGREEFLANRPAVGKTGQNLELLLSKIVGVRSRWPLCRRSVEIINASRVPHYKDSPDGNEVQEKEIKENIEFAETRLSMASIRTVLVFGEHAKSLVSQIGQNTLGDKCVCFCRHIGNQGLSVKGLQGGREYPWPKQRNCDLRTHIEWRIDCVARFLMDSWNKIGFHCAEKYFRECKA